MFYSPKLSLSDILGKEYTASVAGALDALGVMPEKDAQAIAEEKVDFYPEALQKKNEELLDQVGTQIAKPFRSENKTVMIDENLVIHQREKPLGTGRNPGHTFSDLPHLFRHLPCRPFGTFHKHTDLVR